MLTSKIITSQPHQAVTHQQRLDVDPAHRKQYAERPHPDVSIGDAVDLANSFGVGELPPRGDELPQPPKETYR